MGDADRRDRRTAAVPGSLKTELFAFVVELNTDVCVTAREAAVAIRELRALTGALAAGARLRGSPRPGRTRSRVPAEQQIVDEPRYRKMRRVRRPVGAGGRA